MRCGHTRSVRRRAFAAIVGIWALTTWIGEWARNRNDAASDDAVAARHANAKMRKATKFVTRNEGGAFGEGGTADPERKISLTSRGERSIEVVRDVPGVQLSNRQVTRLVAAICGMLFAEMHA